MTNTMFVCLSSVSLLSVSSLHFAACVYVCAGIKGYFNMQTSSRSGHSQKDVNHSAADHCRERGRETGGMCWKKDERMNVKGEESGEKGIKKTNTFADIEKCQKKGR